MSQLLELDAMKYLFQVGENECQNKSALEKLRTLRDSNEIVVLNLGTFVSLSPKKWSCPCAAQSFLLESEISCPGQARLRVLRGIIWVC